MRPIAVFVLVAVFSVATLAASAKVINTHQNNADQQSVVGVAGPESKRVKADGAQADKPAVQPSKQALKKAKVKPKPGMNDPN